MAWKNFQINFSLYIRRATSNIILSNIGFKSMISKRIHILHVHIHIWYTHIRYTNITLSSYTEWPISHLLSLKSYNFFSIVYLSIFLSDSWSLFLWKFVTRIFITEQRIKISEFYYRDQRFIFLTLSQRKMSRFSTQINISMKRTPSFGPPKSQKNCSSTRTKICEDRCLLLRRKDRTLYFFFFQNFHSLLHRGFFPL